MSIILTGDRPTGSLHLGHYIGSLRNRVELQLQHTQYLLIADNQALTDNMGNPMKVRDNIVEVAKDYLASGIDPTKTTIAIQSLLPAIAELTLLYMNFVTVSRLERNPTIRDEIKSRNFGRDIPAGFLAYPVAQAADITAFKASLVPVGEDQAPLIEQANEVVKKVNRQAEKELLPEITALIPTIGRLPSLDGKSKMSKSLGNTITLYSSNDEITKAVRSMFTDPTHIKVSDPGKVDGNVVFTYLDAFDNNVEELNALKEHYISGGLGDSVIKKRLTEILIETLTPIREKRLQLNNEHEYVLSVLKQGTDIAREVTQTNLNEIKRHLNMFFF
jgi:tryptophanyl-tRNA synthetase